MSDKEKAELVNAFWDRLGVPTCTLNEAESVIDLAFECDHVVCLVGEAGIGKTQLSKQYAQKKGWEYLAFYAAHVEREDIIGVPFPVENGDMYKFLTEENIHRVINSGKDTLVVFDEWNRGDKAVMNAIFTVMEERRFGSQVLPKHIHILACMNPSEGSYLVNEAEKDPAFRRRLCFVAVQANEAVWLQYAQGPGKFHPVVTDFIKAKPVLLNDTRTREAGKIYANPAGWEKVSDTCKVLERMNLKFNDPVVRRMLQLKCSGHIGIGATTDFTHYLEEDYMVLSPKQVLFEYKTIQSKVKKQVKEGKNGPLLELCDSVALTLMTDRPPVKDICGNLATFINDLPVDVVRALMSKINGHSTSAGPADAIAAYQSDLANVMKDEKGWTETVERMNQAETNVYKDMQEPTEADKEKKKAKKAKKGKADEADEEPRESGE